MSHKIKVIIFDDEESRREAWRQDLAAAECVPTDQFDLLAFTREEFLHEVKTLEQRREVAREDGRKHGWGLNSIFDRADLLFLDYDLFHLYAGEKHETGEYLTYLARCYSRCGILVVLNQFGESSFDLTLHGHPESFADLNLGSKQLSNRGLWEQPWTEAEEPPFRPWHWPLLPQAIQDFQKRVEDLMEPGALDQPILDFLGFDQTTIELLPRVAAAFLDAGEPGIEKITFRQFVEGSEHGKRPKDRLLDESHARVAASRIFKWLERLILAGQELLVDAPHLVQEYPFLLNRNRDLDTWNSTTQLTYPHFSSFDLEEYRFKKPHWLSRQAWFGERARDHLWDLAEQHGRQGSGYVFCEDRSCFLPRDRSKAFQINLATNRSVRYVGTPLLSEVDYRPRVNFSR